MIRRQVAGRTNVRVARHCYSPLVMSRIIIFLSGFAEVNMGIKLTERAQRALILAEEEACNEKSDYIGIEHLVKACLRVQAEKDLEAK